MFPCALQIFRVLFFPLPPCYGEQTCIETGLGTQIGNWMYSALQAVMICGGHQGERSCEGVGMLFTLSHIPSLFSWPSGLITGREKSSNPIFFRVLKTVNLGKVLKNHSCRYMTCFFFVTETLACILEIWYALQSVIWEGIKLVTMLSLGMCDNELGPIHRSKNRALW